MALTRHIERANDLLQATFMRVFAGIHRSRPGTTTGSWRITVLRTLFHSESPHAAARSRMPTESARLLSRCR